MIPEILVRYTTVERDVCELISPKPVSYVDGLKASDELLGRVCPAGTHS